MGLTDRVNSEPRMFHLRGHLLPREDETRRKVRMMKRESDGGSSSEKKNAGTKKNPKSKPGILV